MNPFLFILPLVGLVLGWTFRWLYARFQLSSSEQKAARIIQEAQRDAEVRKKELLLETKDQLIREKNHCLEQKPLQQTRLTLNPSRRPELCRPFQA